MNKSFFKICFAGTILFFFGELATAQIVEVVHDEQKCKQWKSMELGPWDFSPDWYYYYLHKNYSGAEAHWEWSGFHSGMRVSFDESRSNVKRIHPVRVAAEELQRSKLREVERERNLIEELYKEDLANQADRMIDVTYPMYKDEFNRMQDLISEGLVLCMTQSKGKLLYQVDELTRQNEIVCESIDYIHKQGIGYELANAKRQKEYEQAKTKMKEILGRTMRLTAIAFAYYK